MATVGVLPGSRNLPSQLTIGDKVVHSGGEGNIYFTTDRQYVVKVYHHPGPDKQKLLKQILELGRNLGEDEQFLAWPLGVVDQMNGQAKVGVVTKLVPPSSHVPLVKMIYTPRDARDQFEQGRSWMDYIKIARGTAAAIRAVHGKGMAHGDVHLKNLLANPLSGEVVLIDLDGLVVKGFLPPQVQGMSGFIAPEVVMGKAKPDGMTDRHSLAVLVLWTLLLRNVMLTQRCYDDEDRMRDDQLGYGQFACFSEHPNDNRNRAHGIGTPMFRRGALSYRALTPKLQDLTERSLIHGLHEPAKRPQAIEWERALAETYDMLVPCRECRQSFFYQYWLQPPPRRQCPFCGAGVRAPFPSVLELLDPAAKGTFVPARTLVVYHGLPLFSDIVEPHSLPPFTRRGVPMVGRTAWDAQAGAYRLQNEGTGTWQLLAGGSGTIGRGTSVVLKRGLLLSLGPGKRLLRVVE